MKRTKSAKSSHQIRDNNGPDSSAGSGAVAINPPDYGLDFVDSGETATASSTAPVQLQGDLEEEELLQGKFAPLQRQGDLEEEELLQGKFAPLQRQGDFDEEELLQGKFAPGGMPMQFETGGESAEHHMVMPERFKTTEESSSAPASVLQRYPMTNTQMRNAGFRYMGDQRWHYDQDGYHVSAIRAEGEVDNFHVVGRWRGGDRNRIDYNEAANNVWNEAVRRQDRPADLDDMRAIASATAPYFGGHVA